MDDVLAWMRERQHQSGLFFNPLLQQFNTPYSVQKDIELNSAFD